jgi:hypothetical protein
LGLNDDYADEQADQAETQKKENERKKKSNKPIRVELIIEIKRQVNIIP